MLEINLSIYSEDNWSLSLQGVVPSLLCTHVLGACIILAWASHNWFLPGVLGVSLHLVASPNEVGSHHLNSFSLVESDLHSAVTFAVPQEIIVVDF